MKILIWAGLFLLLTVAGSTTALAAMRGMPIAATVQGGLLAMTALIAGWGIVLLATAPVTLPRLALANAQARHARFVAASINGDILLKGQGAVAT